MTDKLDEVIRDNPRAGASPDFTQRVMKRIRESQETRPSSFAWKPVLAVATLVIISVLSGVVYEKQKEAERIEAIRIEARQLEAELEALKKQADQSSEVYLGGSENREYVFDLRDLTAPSSEVQTVSQSY